MVALVSALGASAAPAAVEFGDTCAGDEFAPASYPLTTLAAPPAALPLTAPVSGVITKVKTNLAIPVPFAVPTLIKVLRPVSGTTYTLIAESTVNANPGTTTADVRMPVLAGDRLGLRGLPFIFEGTPIPGLSAYCDLAGSQLGASMTDVPPGSNITFTPAVEGRVPIAAVVEPDADNDGYGDETQDLCPQGATVQTACPAVTVDAFSLVGGNAVRVLVATNAAAPVKVAATVNLGKGASAKLNGGTKTVPAGKLVRFTLKFPASLKERLSELEPRKKLTLKITASATNVAGQVSTDRAKAKLKGQG
jgi:hypothetical protein